MEFATDGARHLLGPQPTSRLPGEVNRWLAAQHTPRPAAAPLRIPGPDGSVLVRVLPSSRDDRRQVLLLEAGTGELTVTALRALGLTDRQAQALRTIALGHTPAEAAAGMGIARRTLDKHLHLAYSKLGVSTLAQAAPSALAQVRGRSSGRLSWSPGCLRRAVRGRARPGGGEEQTSPWLVPSQNSRSGGGLRGQ